MVGSLRKLARDTKSLVKSTIKITIHNPIRNQTYRLSFNNHPTWTSSPSRTNLKYSILLDIQIMQAVPLTKRIWYINKIRGCSRTKTPPRDLEQPVAHQITQGWGLGLVVRHLDSFWVITWMQMQSIFRTKMFTIRLMQLVEEQVSSTQVTLDQIGIPTWIRGITVVLVKEFKNIYRCKKLRRWDLKLRLN